MINLLEKAQKLPTSSGCYLMRNNRGVILYVGKAKNLRSRVKSYFDQSVKNAKTLTMVSHVVDFDFVLASSEAEALVLENNLIKEHTPKYNIRLRDDKSYPYVLVNKKDPFPKLEYVRRPKKKSGVELYGPFPSGSNISHVLRILGKSFSLRDCSDFEFKSRKTPCLLYQMHQCTAPCVKLVTEDEYALQLKSAVSFLEGKSQAEKTLTQLKKHMMHLAEQEHFEQAAQLRDALLSLEDFLQVNYKQQVELHQDENVDIVGVYRGEVEIDLSLYRWRRGLLLGFKNFNFLSSDLLQDWEEELSSFLLRFYSEEGESLPEKIIVDLDAELKNFEEGLRSSTDKKIKVMAPKGAMENLWRLSSKHAEEVQTLRLKDESSPYPGLNKLKELLGLDEMPRTLECFDVAIWQGKSPTASQIVSFDGKLEKARYRYFHLEERPEGNNDFAMIEELIGRRVKHGNYPDVFVIDGGKGQVSAFQKALQLANVDVPVVGIAKSRTLDSKFSDLNVEKSEERLVIPGRSNPYVLGKCPSLMRIIVPMRDEAHRFSRKLHHKTEEKRIIHSWVDQIHGISAETRATIQSKIDVPLHTLKSLDVDELAKFFDIGVPLAQKIFKAIHAD